MVAREHLYNQKSEPHRSPTHKNKLFAACDAPWCHWTSAAVFISQILLPDCKSFQVTFPIISYHRFCSFSKVGQKHKHCARNHV